MLFGLQECARLEELEFLEFTSLKSNVRTGVPMHLEAPATVLDASPNGGAPANAEEPGAADAQLAITQIAARGPRGAIALAALAVGVVVALWAAFYLFVFLPRGTIG